MSAASSKKQKSLKDPGSGCCGLFTSESKLCWFGVADASSSDASFRVFESVLPFDSDEINAVSWNHGCTQSPGKRVDSSRSGAQHCVAVAGASGGVALLDSWKCRRFEHSHSRGAALNARICRSANVVATNSTWLGAATHNAVAAISWDTGRVEYSFQSKHTVTEIGFIANRYLMSADARGDITVHNCKSGMVSSTFTDYSYQCAVNRMHVSPSRLNWFAACNETGRVYVFDITRESILYEDATHVSSAHGCAFCPQRSSWLLSSAMDCHILMHDITSKKISAKIKTASPLTCVEWMPNTNYQVVCAGINGLISCYDLRSTREPWLSYEHGSVILNVAMHPTVTWKQACAKFGVSAISPKAADSHYASGFSVPSRVTLEESKRGTHASDTRVAVERMESKTESKSTMDAELAKLLEALPTDLQKASGIEVKPISKRGSFTRESMEKVSATQSPSEGSMIQTVHSIPIPVTSSPRPSATGLLSVAHMTEMQLRDLIREEVLSGERRVLRQMAEMMSSLHADVVSQLSSTEDRVEQTLSRLSASVGEWKRQTDRQISQLDPSFSAELWSNAQTDEMDTHMALHK